MLKSGLRIGAVVVACAAVLAGCATNNSGATTGEASSGGSTVTASAGGGGDAVTPGDGKVLKIGVTFPVLDQFLQKVADGITERAEQDGVEVSIVAADNKADVQLSQVENFISNQVDGIIVIPVDTDAAGPITSAVTGADIPLVYVNRKPSDLPSDVPYVGSDSLVSGVLEMTELAKLAGGKGNVAILQGDPANEAAVLRTQGCNDVVAENPDMEVVATQAGNWEREKGQSITEDWIQSGLDFQVVCANNDEMALGAINALKAAGKLDSVIVGGVDATSDALAAMNAGDLKVTVFQDAGGQGAGGVDAIVQLYNGDEVPSYVDVPYTLVTPENVADFEGK